jgi:predicted nucleic acid-binding protein
VTALLDANIVVRYLIGTPPEQARIAAEIIEHGDEDLFLPPVVVTEVGHVLMRIYRVPRVDVVDRLVALLARPTIQVLHMDKPLAIQALLLCRPSGRVSFADALTWAAARASRVGTVYSFDRRFPADGIELRAGPPR